MRLPLPTCDDTTPEGIETITATLSTTPRSGRPDADVGPDGLGTIVDNDLPEVSLVGPVTVAEGSPLAFTVRLAEAAPVDVVVDVSTAADPAAANPADSTGTNMDYLPVAGRQVTIPAGSLTATANVFTVSDPVDENDETMVLRIDGATSAVGADVVSPAEAVGTITDNDTEPTVTVTGGSASESASPPFELQLSHPSQKAVSVTAATTAGTAAETALCTAVDGSEDYEARTRNVAFVLYATTAAFGVRVCDDTAFETDETFTVTLSAPSNASLGSPASATGTITDNDAPTLCGPATCPPPVIQNQTLLTNTAGGDLTLRLSVDVTSPGVLPIREFTVTAVDGVSVNADKNALNGTHFDLSATTLTFNAANQIQEVTISTHARHDHGTEQRTFTLTIQDTDPARSHIIVTVTATINPPAIGRQ